MREMTPDLWMGYPTVDVHVPWRLESRTHGPYLTRRDAYLPSDLAAGRRRGRLHEAWRVVALKRQVDTGKYVERGRWMGDVHARGFRCVVGPRRGERRLYVAPADAAWDWWKAEAPALVVELEAARVLR